MKHDDKKDTQSERPPRVKRVVAVHREPNQTTRSEKGRQKYAPEQTVPRKAVIADVKEILTPDDERRLRDEEQAKMFRQFQESSHAREIRDRQAKSRVAVSGPPPPAPPPPKKK